MRTTRTSGQRRPRRADRVVRSTQGHPPSRARWRTGAETDDMHSTGNSFPVVGIGASAGGLEAFRKLLAALHADTGIAFVLIPHLDPTHESMMVDLLTRDTTMKVAQASE